RARLAPARADPRAHADRRRDGPHAGRRHQRNDLALAGPSGDARAPGARSARTRARSDVCRGARAPVAGRAGTPALRAETLSALKAAGIAPTARDARRSSRRPRKRRPRRSLAARTHWSTTIALPGTTTETFSMAIFRIAAAGIAAAAALLAPAPASAGPTLDSIKQKDVLRCGVNSGLLGFSAPDSQGRWNGIDADFCRAVAAVILGDANKVQFVPTNTQNRFTVLQSGEVDILS